MELPLKPLFTAPPARRPLIIAGPCSAETEKQVVETATKLKARGFNILRAGLWKPRTKPGGFEGVGEEGLAWLVRVQQEIGMKISTEVATPQHVEKCLASGVDMLWIGARTSANPFAVQDIADALKGVDIPVLIKNPVNPDLDLWIGAVERISGAGIQRLGVIHRGFSTYEKKMYRNAPLWHIPIELHRRLPGLPILCDPSHIGGRRELIPPLCQQAMDLGFDGLIIESHTCPDRAWSDASQQVTPDILGFIIEKLVLRDSGEASEILQNLRIQIDECDNTLLDALSRRMKISREIGGYKKEHNMSIVQTLRYSEIMDKRQAQGTLTGLNPDFIKAIFEAIHEESVHQQIDVINR